MSPYLGRLMVPMIQMMHDNTLQLTLKQNLAIAIGRLGVTNTAEVNTILTYFNICFSLYVVVSLIFFVF